MKLREFLKSPLLPRVEKSPDVWSTESYWGLPHDLGLYSCGFNRTTWDEQSKVIIQHLEKMTPEKYKLLEQFEDYEVKRVKIFSSDGETPYEVSVHIQIDVSNEKLKEMGLL